MELRRAFIVLADISGYTGFIKAHRVSLIHAEHIVTQLLESVIDRAAAPLELCEVEGDSAYFYALSDGSPGQARQIQARALEFFAGFNHRHAELMQRNICTCDGCLKMGDLKLKTVLHHGEIALRRVRQFEKPAGETVIVAHRLLKNSVPENEYLLMSRAFHALSGGFEGAPAEERVETYESVGPVETVVYYPQRGLRPAPETEPALAPVRAGLWDKVGQAVALNAYTLARALGLRRPAAFPSLAGL